MKKFIFIPVLFLVCRFACAQGFYNKGAQVSVASQTVFVLPDSLVNTGTLKNDGDILVSGAWINSGTYDAGAGLINFNSTIAQVINHNDQSMGKLTVSGGGEKQFLANITVQTELQLQNGILVSGNGAKIILSEGAVVSGGNNTSYVKGSVQHRGKGTWLFPIGSGSAYLPVEIAGVTDAAATGTLTLHELTGGQKLTGEDVTSLSSRRYWELVMTGGKLNSGKIKLPLAGEENLTGDAELLVVAASDQASGSYRSLGKSEVAGTLTSGSVTSEQSPAFTFFTVATISGEQDIEVFNGISPDANGKNDFMRISNIESYPQNTVMIFNRWGDRVFEQSGYDNNLKSFRGESNITNSKLPAGVYFYSVDLKNSTPKRTGYVVIK